MGMYNFDEFNANAKENIPGVDMDKLITYADGTLPSWGDSVKNWVNYDKVTL